MEHQETIHKRHVRRAFELRLGRQLSDHEFERLLHLGDGVYWDYRRGTIDPYDLATIKSRQQVLAQWGKSKRRAAFVLN